MAVLRIVFIRSPETSIIVYGQEAVKEFPGGAFLSVPHISATRRTRRGMPRMQAETEKECNIPRLGTRTAGKEGGWRDRQ